MASPKEQISKIKQTLPPEVKLVAVSKYHPAEMIQEAYDAGQRIFGESHVQEMVQKHEALPQDIEWHFIGHLQTNKVKYIAPFVSLIHAVDSDHLLREIDKQAGRLGRIIPVLMQVHVAQEETKFGFLPDELLAYMQSGVWREYQNVSIRGLMCMATNTDDEVRIANDFERANQLFNTINVQWSTVNGQSSTVNGQSSMVNGQSSMVNGGWDIRSWGMSHDFPIAVRHGSNMVRIGSLIFGERE